MNASFVETVIAGTTNLDLSKTTRGSQDLTGLCTDVFHIVIRMCEAEDLGDPASLRKLVLHYLGLLEKNCRAIGVEPQSVSDVRYALVALIDETVLGIPGACRDFWVGSPLQLDLFGDNIAGEEFYARINRLIAAPDKKRDVLEVFYLSLSLGFEGKFKLFHPEERIALMEKLGRVVNRGVQIALSPHGRGEESGLNQKKRKSARFPLWVTAVIGSGICAGAWALFYYANVSAANTILNTLKP